MLEKQQIAAALDEFVFKGKVVQVEYPYGEGHINDTIRIKTKRKSGKTTRYIVQRINQQVFKKPGEVMANIASVSSFLRDKIIQEGGDPERETLSIIMTKLGGLYHIDAAQNYWRAYPYIEHTVTKEVAGDAEALSHAALAFGRFLLRLQDYPVSELYEVMPDFHDTRRRFAQFQAALTADRAGRASLAQGEITFILAREQDCGQLLAAYEGGQLPLRVTHNDSKLNNVLFDKKTGQGLCVVDLDTVMPGLAAYDFGDAIRFGASTAREDEQDLGKVHFDIGLYRIFTQSYLSLLAPIFSEQEASSLAWGARLLTLEQAMRFLTDYLAGDAYYKCEYPEHNLMRARNQIKLLQEMEAQWEAMQADVLRYWKKYH